MDSCKQLEGRFAVVRSDEAENEAGQANRENLEINENVAVIYQESQELYNELIETLSPVKKAALIRLLDLKKQLWDFSKI